MKKNNLERIADKCLKVFLSGKLCRAVYANLNNAKLSEAELATRMSEIARNKGKNYQYTTQTIKELLRPHPKRSRKEDLDYLFEAIDRADLTKIFEDDIADTMEFYKNTERADRLRRHRMIDFDRTNQRIKPRKSKSHDYMTEEERLNIIGDTYHCPYKEQKEEED